MQFLYIVVTSKQGCINNVEQPHWLSIPHKKEQKKKKERRMNSIIRVIRMWATVQWAAVATKLWK